MSNPKTNVEQAVRRRYSRAAVATEPALCCAVSYDRRYLAALPPEIVDRDYGCGDPTRGLRPGQTVLDLGSGAGKACYIAAQIVGAAGRVIGIDMNDEMLTLAERHHATVAGRLGYDNVAFVKCRIQDLALADTSVDVVVSNCVLNLVAPADKRRLFAEMRRVLRPGGRAVIADIVSDRDVPARMQADPELWSGCISGVFREDRFLRAFQEAGFGEVRSLARDDRPWRVVEGIEFRSLTLEAEASISTAGGRAQAPRRSRPG